ncbi:MAG: polysaccharide deacetylase family protein [Chitinivibrionales bacterium]|nr:polysaccharide deacetylase family protein [Chitinivibrionales bacterium]
MYFHYQQIMLGLHLAILILTTPLLAGIISVLLLGRSRRNTDIPPGIVIHSVINHARSGFTYYNSARFRQLIARLDELRYTACTLKAGISNCREQIQHGRMPFILTFDDGFANFFEQALPVLQEYDFKATIFPIADFLGTREAWDIFSPLEHLSVTHVREIARLGFEIGSHTATHACLPFLSDRDAIEELRKSKNTLEDTIGAEVVSLSFPYGCWSLRIWQLAQDLGYRYATSYRSHHTTSTGIVAVHGVYSLDTPEDVVLKITKARTISNSLARSHIIPHFAKGSTIWRFRAAYAVERSLLQCSHKSKPR